MQTPMMPGMMKFPLLFEPLFFSPASVDSLGTAMMMSTGVVKVSSEVRKVEEVESDGTDVEP